MSEERWELVEVFDGQHKVVGRYTDEKRAKNAAALARLAGAPTEPGDIWDPCDYYVREGRTASPEDPA